MITNLYYVNTADKCTRDWLFVFRRSAGVLGRSGAHGDHIPVSVGHPEMLQQTGQPREEGGEQKTYSTQG